MCKDILKDLSHQITVDRPESDMVGSAWMGILSADGGIRIANGLRNVNVISPAVFHCMQFADNSCQLLKMVTSGKSHSSKVIHCISAACQKEKMKFL